MIYLLVSDDRQYCKIGLADNVTRRIASIQTSCPFDLTVEATRDGDLLLEQAIHAACADFHLRREWFRFCGDVVARFHAAAPFARKRDTFAAALNDFLLFGTITEGSLGALAGVSQASVNRYRQGERFPSADVARQIDVATSGEVPFSIWQSEFMAKSGLAA